MNPELQERLEQLALSQANSGKSTTISEDKYKAILHHLENPDVKVDFNFKHWVKSRELAIVDLPGLGLKDVLCIPNKNQAAGGPKYLRICHHRQIFDIVHSVHSDELMHSGYKKVLEYVRHLLIIISAAKLAV
jgi:GTP-binding protein EngB required for normal cell division